MSLKYADEESLGRAMFGHAELGDVRRTERLVETFDRCRRHPGGTLPDKLSSPADLKALYRLCASEAVTPAALVAAMRVHALARIAAHEGPVLVLHDASELPGNPSYSDYGPRAILARRRAFQSIRCFATGKQDPAMIAICKRCRPSRPPSITFTETQSREASASRDAIGDGQVHAITKATAK